ncbi:hypothetical protein F889_01219 [Acinetobacter colistiniresistens]|uniref:Filamentous haemagglutinin FhaB/tRNA nuclease CdiA-like TPS domain-containing protein n=1 Tax=Acinetobacter colistiniresistens TaxID=280145 RepID=N9RAC8_9GAMM|nr:DUF637 domain-containing protein [Acinetobacter colistiniresistens]ENX35550.1 hypothetical protein F889_01219 [Acinetobacter colistiniresistens]
MNKQFYRTKFNAKLGTYVAVSELAKSHQGDTSPRIKTSIHDNGETETSIVVTGQRTLKQLVLALSALMAISPIYANVVVNNGAAAVNKATVLKEGNAANIWITAPSASGVSRNSYTQFDVNQNGVILNNSRGAATSQITKTSIAANPNLAKGAATTIVNEVVSTNPSLLQGNLEVLGSRANVVIANPTGITVNGGGFINANQVTLSTGVLGYNTDGSIKDHTVKQGAITINPDVNNRGLGGNANNPIALELLGRSIAINAPVNADTITAVTGANAITAETGAVTTTAGTWVVPMVAIDVAQLGGLYANSIYLHANEAGVGVNNAGVIQAQNNVVLNSNGKIEHKGTIISTSKTQGLVSINTTGADVTGDINLFGNIDSNSMISIDSGNHLNVNAKEIKINNGGVVSSPLLINAKGNLNLAANSRIFNDASRGDLYIEAENINLATNSEVRSNRGSANINILNNLISAQNAGLVVSYDLNIAAGNKQELTGSILQATLGTINLQAGSKQTKGLINIQDGTIWAGENLNLNSSGDIKIKNMGLVGDNSFSKVKNINAYTGQNLTWEHTGTALPQISGKVQLDAANQLNLLNGTLSAKDDINLQANQLVLGSALTSDKSINITSKVSDLTLSHALTAKGDINASATIGSLTTSGLKATSHDGKLSLMANKNVTLTHAGPSRSILLGAQGVNIASVGDGDVTSSSTDLYSSQGNILVSSNLKNTLTDTTLNATKNIEVFAKDNLTLDGLITLGRAHTALSSKKNIYINSIAGVADAPVNTLSPQSQFNSNGVLSITSGKNINVQNARLTAGALLIEAGESLNGFKSMELNATGSDLLKNDTKLNSLNGDLSIQTGSDLTIDPTKHKLSAVGDIDLVSKKGNLTLIGYGGASGNGSEKVVNLNTVNGGINLQGNKIELQGSQLNAAKDISIVSTGGDLVIDGVKNTLVNFKPITRLNYVEAELIKLNETKKQIEESSQFLKDKQALIDLVKSNSSQYINKTVRYSTDSLNQELMKKFESEILNFYKKYNTVIKIEAVSIPLPPPMMNQGYLGIVGVKTDFDTPLATEIKEKIEEKAYYSQLLNGYEHTGSEVTSTVGKIDIVSAKGISISGSDINAKKGEVNIEAAGTLTGVEHQIQGKYKNEKPNSVKQGAIQGSVVIDGLQDSYEIGQTSNDNYNWRSPINVTNINGDKGVKIKATGKAATDNLILQGVGITANNGDVNIEAYKNIIFDVAIENGYDKSKKVETKRKWYGKKKTTTTVKIAEQSSGVSVDIDAKNINIKSQEVNTKEMTGQNRTSIDMYSSQLTSNGGKISIQAGGDLNFLTANDESLNTTDISKKSSFVGIKLNSSKTTNTRNIKSELPAVLNADYIGTKSGFDTRLKGTVFNYLEGAEIQAGGNIILEGASTTVTETLKKESNSVVWQSMQDKGSITETAKLPSFNGLTPPKFIANGGLTVQVPVVTGQNNDVRAEVIKLSNQPGNEYLKDLIARKDVNWEAVKLAQESWDYKSQGLTAAGAAILAIAITAVSGGAGIGAILGTSGTMTNAALLSLTTQASISLINNGGDISATFKELGSKDSIKITVTAAVTAGLMEGVSTSLKIDIKELPTVEKMTNNFVQGVGSNLISSTLQGESLSDSINKALLSGLSSSLQGELAGKIKGLEDVDYVLHKIAHAAAGCLAGALQKSCEAGAIGAAIGEIVAGQLNDGSKQLTLNEKEKIINQSKLVASVVAAYTGYDVNAAASSADNAVRNNNTAYAFDPATFDEILNEKAEPLKVTYYRDKNNQVMMCLSALITPCNVSGTPVSISEIFDALVGPTLEVIDKTPQGQGKKKVVNVIEELVTKKSIQATGRVASRVNVRNGDANITGSGLEYAWKKHGGSWGTNKSAFTISKDELKLLLQNPQVVKTPAYQSSTSGNYIRTVDVGRNIGVDSKNGGKPTTIMTVITDKQGNLVNTFPGKTIN